MPFKKYYRIRVDRALIPALSSHKDSYYVFNLSPID